MFSSPEPAPGHYSDPGLRARLKALNEYNALLTALRKNGIKDHAGHRDFGSERVLRGIYTGAINQLMHAATVELVEQIRANTEAKLDALNLKAAA